ncbi:tRNA (N6-threonylcarbamoyladenosine(37)-N6)-methyltransferase TrmO [Porticoccus sp. W117]|uniref:tRNA (N6-threonylcarbamoyladenosine(37)-N6)-methyltransferase TrmO n=1 Tax=Porticoccus sp. W117 TaxID=3054777 RepID=UPI0025951B6B|nr:tRNA (N6-threonylcarbamoyladenosine(37)-N6)-methyltransferase TrmO [Porticoccus sp. W117]MDM3871953.1 tRNA (N6-threonylcarbamoyladenosine(37)-N6)-methyltransferase TrmO [Porticoccus sp. W117]
MSTQHFDIIGTVHSPYKEKFAVPRQPGLVPAAKGRIELLPPYNDADSVRDLSQFSHIWVLFVFHGTQEQGWKPLVRPPRLGGNQKTGVFATRSTFRPNPIGMSVVALDEVEEEGRRIWLNISGLDLIDQTPVLDIKPYLPYCDSLPDASSGFANNKPETKVSVEFSRQAEQQLRFAAEKIPDLRELICQVLSQDPRPAYRRHKKSDNTRYGVRLYNFNIVWIVQSSNDFQVVSIEKENKGKSHD